jgi:hypothetical protein
MVAGIPSSPLPSNGLLQFAPDPQPAAPTTKPVSSGPPTGAPKELPAVPLVASVKIEFETLRFARREERIIGLIVEYQTALAALESENSLDDIIKETTYQASAEREATENLTQIQAAEINAQKNLDHLKKTSGSAKAVDAAKARLNEAQMDVRIAESFQRQAKPEGFRQYEALKKPLDKVEQAIKLLADATSDQETILKAPHNDTSANIAQDAVDGAARQLNEARHEYDKALEALNPGHKHTLKEHAQELKRQAR